VILAVGFLAVFWPNHKTACDDRPHGPVAKLFLPCGEW
jgi:hypothetical protein